MFIAIDGIKISDIVHADFITNNPEKFPELKDESGQLDPSSIELALSSSPLEIVTKAILGNYGGKVNFEIVRGEETLQVQVPRGFNVMPYKL